MMKNESGRSMVEMLGVLAIIGVLSVGGIAGYTMAMRKYKANEIMSAAAQCVMLARSSNQGEGFSTASSTFCSSITFPESTTYSVKGDLTSGEIVLTFKDHALCAAASAIKAPKDSDKCTDTNDKVATFVFS